MRTAETVLDVSTNNGDEPFVVELIRGGQGPLIRWCPFLARRRTQCPPSEQIGQLTEMCFTLITVQQQDLIQYQRANILSPTSRIAPRLVAGNTHSPSGGSLTVQTGAKSPEQTHNAAQAPISHLRLFDASVPL